MAYVASIHFCRGLRFIQRSINDYVLREPLHSTLQVFNLIFLHFTLESYNYIQFLCILFRFDDIYLGILAKKSDITPFHSKEFYFYKKDYNSYNYRYVIASHGYSDSPELLRVWNEQRAAGNA